MNSNMTRRALLSTAASLAWLGLLGRTTAYADPTSQELQAQLDEARSKLDSMGGQLNSLQQQLMDSEDAIEITRGQIEDTTAQIDDTTAQLASKRTILGDRMRSGYKAGGLNSLDFILGSTSATDLVSRIHYMDKVNESDAQAIQEVQALETQLQQQKADLESQQENQQEQLDQSQQAVDEYTAQVVEVQAYYDSLDSQVQEALAREAAEAQAKAEAEADAKAAALAAATSAQTSQESPSSNGGEASSTSSSNDSTSAPTGNSGSSTSTSPSSSSTGSQTTNSSTSSTSSSASSNASSGQTSISTAVNTATKQGSSNSTSTSSSVGTNHGSIVANAAQFIGKPYKRWTQGRNYGPDADGFDCCGLVATAYHLAGYSTPYATSVPGLMSWVKSRGNWKDCNMSNYSSVLSPGDIIFVTSGHVAIYAGGNQMIHAPLPGQYVCYYRVFGCIGGGFGG